MSAGVSTSSATGTVRTNFRPDIDGIRGAAAIMVMLFHAEVPGLDGAVIALDLFFVVSGFVIGGLLLKEWQRTGRVNWWAFYARRARRLIPAKATMLVGVLLLSAFLVPPTGVRQETAISAATSAGFFSNVYFWRGSDVDYFGVDPGTGVLLHTWSLALEEQFYVGVPIVVVLGLVLSRVSRLPLKALLLILAVVLSVISLVLAVLWSASHPSAAYYLPITRGYEFGLGVALAIVNTWWRPHGRLAEALGLAGAAGLVLLLVFPVPIAGYPSYWALLPCLATAALLWAGTAEPVLASKWLSNGFLVPLGLVSYSWYLWHWPLLVMAEAINLAPPPLWGRLLLILAALGLGALSYRFVERLFYVRSDRKAEKASWPAPRVILGGVLAMGLVAGLAGGALAAARNAAEQPRWVTVNEQLDDVPDLPDRCLEGTQIIPSQPGPCFLNTWDEDRPTVVLWGDSIAWMFIPALRKASRGQVNLVAFVMGSCPPFNPNLPAKGARRCSEQNEQALAFVSKKRPAPLRVILGASWENYRGDATQSLLDRRQGDRMHERVIAGVSPKLRRGTAPLFAELGKRGVAADVIAPVAELPRNGPLCEVSLLPLACNVDHRLIFADARPTQRWLERITGTLPEGARMIAVDRAICDPITCFSELKGISNYFDDRHLSATRAEKMARFFRPTIRATNAAPSQSGG